MLAVLIPGVKRALGRRTVAIMTPMMIAVTGAPISGTNRPTTVATMAMLIANPRPGTFAMKESALGARAGECEEEVTWLWCSALGVSVYSAVRRALRRERHRVLISKNAGKRGGAVGIVVRGT